MQRVVKAKTRPGKRFLDKREAKLIENDKKCICLRGSNANNTVMQVMKDFAMLKKPLSTVFNKKRDMRPMDDVTPMEIFCKKNDASLFMFGSHNKKRPNNMILGRMFDFHVLDMFELGIEEFKALTDFKTAKIATATKPMLLFTEGFDEQPEYKRLKNFFIDFFRGPVVENINLQGLEHLIVFSLVNKKILFRSYRVTLKKSDTKGPGVELLEIGPHMNFVLRRSKLASEDLFKTACRKPKQLKPKKVKNVKRDVFGSTQGRIHMERQDYSKLQTRKVKGLKKRRFERQQETTSSEQPSPKQVKLETDMQDS